MAERCNYLQLFLLLHIASPLFLQFSKTGCFYLSQAGSSYQNRGVEDDPWQRSSPEERGGPYSRNSGKLDILLVLLISTRVSPKVTATRLGVTSTATETLSSPSSSSLQNMAGEETTSGFDDPNALSITILMTLGNSSVQTLGHP